MKHLDNKTLLRQTQLSAKKEKQACLELLDYLVEVDTRAAYVELGYHSLHQYIMEGLGYTEDQTYLRVNAVRMMKKMPEIKEDLQNNQLSLSTLANINTIDRELKEQQKPQELSEIVEQFRGKTKQEAKEVMKELRGEKKSSPRKKETKRIVLTLTAEEYELVQKVLMLKNQSPSEFMLDQAKQTESKIQRTIERPTKTRTTHFRHIPLNVKRKILLRAKGKCEAPGCTEKSHLQFAHREAYSKGGVNTENNLRLLCRGHHQYETFIEFGRRNIKSL